MRKLEPRIRSIWIIGSLVLAVLLGGVAAVIALEFNGNVFPGIAVFLAVFVLGVLYSVKKYGRWGFELKKDHLYLEHGVFKRVYSMVPYVRVQHVDTQRGVLERLAGLSRVVVYTAGSRGADVAIPGLLPEDAERIQGKLRDVAIESEDRDAV